MKRELCEIYVPIGFSTVRFGTTSFCRDGAFRDLMGLIRPGRSCLGGGVGQRRHSRRWGSTALPPWDRWRWCCAPSGSPTRSRSRSMIIIDPIAEIIRVMLNVTVNCTIPGARARRRTPVRDPSAVDLIGAEAGLARPLSGGGFHTRGIDDEQTARSKSRSRPHRRTCSSAVLVQFCGRTVILPMPRALTESMRQTDSRHCTSLRP